MLIFADDIKIFRPINLDENCLLLQRDLVTVSNWCTKNKLSLNSGNIRMLNHVNEIRDFGVHE